MAIHRRPVPTSSPTSPIAWCSSRTSSRSAGSSRVRRWTSFEPSTRRSCSTRASASATSRSRRAKTSGSTYLPSETARRSRIRRARVRKRPMATVVQAIRLALHVGEERFGVTDIFGQDVGPPLGGVFTQTQGLRSAWNSPLDERGIVGAAIGLALAGQRPVAEIQFCDYAFNMVDLLKLAGGICWSSAGDYNCPMVLMTIVGSGIRGSLYHSHSFDAQATRIPGWKIVMPSNPLDAYGLLLSAIADPNPVMFLAPKALLRAKAGPDERIPGEPDDDRTLGKMIDAPLGDRSKWRPDWPDVQDFFIPFGKARVCREGRDVTVVTYGRMVVVAAQAAELVAAAGVDVEVIDLRS